MSTKVKGITVHEWTRGAKRGHAKAVTIKYHIRNLTAPKGKDVEELFTLQGGIDFLRTFDKALGLMLEARAKAERELRAARHAADHAYYDGQKDAEVRFG